MLIFDRRSFLGLMAEATSPLQCGGAVNNSRNAARAGILIPSMGWQKRNSYCAATQLAEGQANARAAGAPKPRAKRPFGRYSRFK
jgi:hypothetical protein